MTEPAWVDVVVPYAGSADLLRETVRSVLQQTVAGWRLVVVEDGLQDPGVGAWLRSLDDPRVEHVLNPRNLGVAGNFQRCLELTTAPLVVLLGCDDRLHPTYLATVRRGLEQHPSVAVVQPGVRVVDADGRPARPMADRVKHRLSPRSGRPVVLSGEPLLRSLLHGNWTYFPSLCWRRAPLAAHGFRPDLPTTLDLALLAALVLDGAQLLVLPDVVFDYRRHDASASSRTAVRAHRFAEERRVSRELAEAAASRGWTSAARAARRRATSRLHAAALLPGAVSRRDLAALRLLARHVLGS